MKRSQTMLLVWQPWCSCSLGPSRDDQEEKGDEEGEKEEEREEKKWPERTDWELTGETKNSPEHHAWSKKQYLRCTGCLYAAASWLRVTERGWVRGSELISNRWSHAGANRSGET